MTTEQPTCLFTDDDIMRAAETALGARPAGGIYERQNWLVWFRTNAPHPLDAPILERYHVAHDLGLWPKETI